MTKQQKSTTPVNFEGIANPQHTIDLVASSFELLRGKIEEADWLEKFARASNAESALCVRWSCGRPESLISSFYGNFNHIPAGWTNWADHMCNLAKPDACIFLDDMLAEINQQELTAANPIKDPQLLICLVDWEHAFNFLMIHRDASLGAWSTAERNQFAVLANLARRSMQLHKFLAQAQNLASATVDILNSSPRGIIALSVDGRIQYANTLAKNILDANDGLSSQNNKLLIKDKNSMLAFEDLISTVKILKLSQLNYDNTASTKNFSCKRPSGNTPYQIMIGTVPLTSWSMESSPSDRMIIVYIHDPAYKLQPTIEQLKNYYGLTTAQSRLALRLYLNDSIANASEYLGISINTSRSHLRSVLAKTGAKNQAELLSLLASTLKTSTGLQH